MNFSARATLTTKRSPVRVLPTLLLALAAAGLPATAQDEGASPSADDVFVDRIEVSVVNVEVVVTDKSGNRVTGLKKEDFELFEDGRPIPISNFYAIEDGRPVAGPAAPATAATAAPENLPEELPRPGARRSELPPDQQLYLILYVDNLFIKPFSRNKVAGQIRTFLRENVGRGDHVMLATFDRSLHVRQPMTTDLSLVTDALYEIEGLTGYGVQAETEHRDAMRRIQTAQSAQEASGFVDSYAQSLYHEATSSIDALKELVGTLGGVEGRKAVLHVSDGIPMVAAEELYHMLDLRLHSGSNDQRGVAGNEAGRGFSLLRSRQYSLRRQLYELTTRANANRVTFYTLEAAGLRAHTSISAEYGGSVGTDGVVGGSDLDVDAMRAMNFQQTLMAMATRTGGVATFSTNNFAGALDNMNADLRSYYSLGYIPARSGDGRYHEIKVDVKRKGLTARHRTGYRDKSATTRLSEGTYAALLYGAGSNPLNVEIVLLTVRRDDDGRLRLPVEVRVPLGNTALLPRENLYQGRLRFSLAAVDEEGELSPVELQTVPLTVPADEIEIARTKYFTYAAELLIDRGKQVIAVGVRDDFSAETSFVRASIDAGR